MAVKAKEKKDKKEEEKGEDKKEDKKEEEEKAPFSNLWVSLLFCSCCVG